jgi:hypothetical protein
LMLIYLYNVAQAFPVNKSTIILGDRSIKHNERLL